MIRSLLMGLALVLGASQAIAQEARQPSSGAELWAISDTRIASVPARIAFPLRAGVVSAQRHQEFSHPGQGLDSGIQYQSSDRAVFATVYVYYPGLPHAGLSAFATDNAMRLNSETPISGGEPRVVAAGGVENAAIRADYLGYRGDNASSAAWIKAGRWIVKLRVTGPAARRDEVIAAMDALLRDIQFGVSNPPRPVVPLTITECPAGAGERRATLLPDPPSVELAAHGLLATFDGAGIAAEEEGRGQVILPSRVPTSFCRTILTARNARIPILRAEPGDARSVDGRTMLIISLSDSGTLLELVHAPNLGGHILLYHQIGRTTVLGRFDGVPSDAQIVEMLNDPQSPATRFRVPVLFRPDRGPEIQLQAETPAPAQPTT